MARLHGTGAHKPLLIIGHIDVVEARREDWTTNPFELVEKDGYFYGRGTQDMKVSDAAAVTAFIRFKRENYRPDRDIILALTADEEGGKSNGVDWLLRNHRDETGARLEGRIIELSIALVPFKVRGVGSGKKSALMMVEPPGDLRRTGVLEIDDGIFVTIEMRFVKQRSRAMQQAGKDKAGVFADALAVEAGEERGGGSSVKALVVVEDSDFQSIPQLSKISADPRRPQPGHFEGQGKS